MSKYDDMEPPKEPFEPTPWLVILVIVMSIAFTSYISESC